MTEVEKKRIKELHYQGLGYRKIAAELGMSPNTVKYVTKNLVATDNRTCRNCGVKVLQTAGRKEKKFCSDKCRMDWWNSHLDTVNRKGYKTFTCKCCSKEFMAYARTGRKYCSRECYFKARYGGAR